MTMIPAQLEAYREVAPQGTLELLARLAERLRGRRFVHVNAGRYGGGSPEILNRLVPMMQDMGIDSAWEVIVGDPEFYAAIRALELAAAGREHHITDSMLRSYEGTAAANWPALPLDADLVMIHDLAPLPLVRHRRDRGRWVWALSHRSLPGAPTRLAHSAT
jgi:trehalose synthase